jgi:hypothetical protein
MNTYFSSQSSRPTPYIPDGLRKYSGSDNPQYIIQDSTAAHQPERAPVKVELTSDVQKTLEQTKEEMVAPKRPVKRKRPATKKKPAAAAKRRRVTSNKTKSGKKKRSFTKKKPTKKHITVFSKNGRKKP